MSITAFDTKIPQEFSHSFLVDFSGLFQYLLRPLSEIDENVRWFGRRFEDYLLALQVNVHDRSGLYPQCIPYLFGMTICPFEEVLTFGII
ncbi:predicted coding region AF_1386 [Archaeoglobus fulgidus DSM 4304]|uniref:Uncharacterized protein AF_1386 n=1 Tax=Archaeoglobus fulgidus (strain ATCC 49558 / DSM 4304 / JCM 9628 / NBRC 100126 / VC-16) TaxID=224325 RepID=Y1386_ARCFU|nr:RecName: Full=Uncharacterized protein AF_1386 [Archaeoglobus fulgidus DSM 4304]AAB89880.1 predicted coding region AF_1386 [Archaeoglobus fulgidus DSM 4304]